MIMIFIKLKFNFLPFAWQDLVSNTEREELGKTKDDISEKTCFETMKHELKYGLIRHTLLEVVFTIQIGHKSISWLLSSFFLGGISWILGPISFFRRSPHGMRSTGLTSPYLSLPQFLTLTRG